MHAVATSTAERAVSATRMKWNIRSSHMDIVLRWTSSSQNTRHTLFQKRARPAPGLSKRPLPKCTLYQSCIEWTISSAECSQARSSNRREDVAGPYHLPIGSYNISLISTYILPISITILLDFSHLALVRYAVISIAFRMIISQHFR